MSEPRIYFIPMGEAFEQPGDPSDMAMIEKSAFDALKKEFESAQAEIAKLRQENDNLKAGISYMGKGQLMSEHLKVIEELARTKEAFRRYREADEWLESLEAPRKE